MYLVTIVLDRVFDVVYWSSNDADQTMFSIETGGRKVYGLKLAGRVELHDGMTVSAVLDRADDWQSLLAMRGHDSGEIYRNDAGKSLALLMNMCLGFVFVFALLVQTVHMSRLGFALLASIFVCAMGHMIAHLAGRRRKITRLLGQAVPPG